MTLNLAGDNKGPLLKEEVEKEERDELSRKTTLGWGVGLNTDTKVKSHILNHYEKGET